MARGIIDAVEASLAIGLNHSVDSLLWTKVPGGSFIRRQRFFSFPVSALGI
ncbi:hypothetical protein TRIATDRAFT_232203 [Trichoderma atroviride IMI 206040]|uniref:Uncharacterized protein n=1 Tax=Hypocrea atroviridis (strain ATCC 20476 / IMI 206040) TaxID=452589 RepID=G9NDX7_HYPAI|nr:uncharacterized protein TRIATDRAFT_232203 [Trichoderma atroviride IMI 206040]EHK51147.1 hypothetical protein TRIATDRAFT_232203 [Trichoderma atroviride IMI 206040]